MNEHNSSWSLIAQFFNGRSDNDIKNRWYSHLKYETIQKDDKYVFSAGATARKKRNRLSVSPKKRALTAMLEQLRPASAAKPETAMIAIPGTLNGPTAEVNLGPCTTGSRSRMKTL
jgi:hypothetical protein